MMDFEIRPDWCQPEDVDFAQGAVPEALLDEASICELQLVVGGIPVTRMIDAEQHVHNGPRVSAFRFAEWLLWNWWRLRWEPAPSGGGGLSWRQAHETASIGGGWLWPNLSFESDGRTVAVRSHVTEATVTAPVSYVGQGEWFVPAPVFERGIDSFVGDLIDRLQGSTRREEPIAAMLRELEHERSDPQASVYRRLEALLGCSPDGGDEGVIEQLMRDRDVLGEDATDEVAADAPHGTGEAARADDLLTLAQDSGLEVHDEDVVALPATDGATAASMASDEPGASVPWLAGVTAAQRLRRHEGLGHGPIADRWLCEMCGLPGDSLRGVPKAKPRMAYTLATAGGKRMVFRARIPTGRRFDAARLLGDKLLVHNDESLRPATASHTFRQKMQRAFAVEFLCPIEGLVDRLDGDYSDVAIEEAATSYRVSPMLVATHMENNGIGASGRIA